MTAADSGGHRIELRDEADREGNPRKRQQGGREGQAEARPQPEETAIVLDEIGVPSRMRRREQRDDGKSSEV